MADKITPDMSDDQVRKVLDGLKLDPSNPEAARPVMMGASPRQIFMVIFPYMVEKFPEQAEKAKEIEGSVKWVIEGAGGGSFLMKFGAGGLKVEESDAEATATVTLDVDTWKDILSGQSNPQAAFMSGKMTVAGDMGLLMQLQSVMPAM